MAIIRQKRERNYSVVSNEILEDTRMSFKARGLLIYMLSKPDDWKFYSEELVKHSDKDGISSIKTALNELEKCGYLKRIQKRAEKGKFGGQDWILNDNPENPPQVGFPLADNPSAEKPSAENRTLLSTDSTKYLNNQLLNSSSRAAENTAEEPTETPEPETQNSTENDPWNLWEQNWGFPNSIAQQDLMEWCKQFGNDLVYHVVEYALKSNVTSKGADRYLARVFDSYEKNQIDTVAKAVEQEEQHYQQKTREFANKRQYGGKYQARQKEQLPDWAKDDHKVEEQSDGDKSTEEVLKQRADIEQRMKDLGLK
ncbi:DnaD domain protein [Ligilactobacillus pobuzihii]|uniref:DnaD domain protein n=1 Tax=Ligilactobacillus pobuzihii TaxID=449659 RepID=UPI0019D0EC04|nr:DnaD domain protein [Ligilactobacillus pobuzihii]MBN7275540.1 DnaD domain protein [Ligilactobacillus pobuzihii]